MLATARDAGWVVGNNVGVEYVSRVPGPPLDGLIDDLYYLEGAPPYSRLMLPAAPAPLLIVNLGAPFLIRAGTDVDAVEYADGCAVTTPTRAWEFSYPTPTRSVGPLQAVGPGTVPSDARGRVVRPTCDGGADLGSARYR
jgi:hypothetical protein